MAKVYVVGYDPIENRASVGGFDWFWDHEEAWAGMVRNMKDSGETHFLWFRTHETKHSYEEWCADKSVREKITAEIDSLNSWYGPDGDWDKPVPPPDPLADGDPEGDMTPP